MFAGDLRSIIASRTEKSFQGCLSISLMQSASCSAACLAFIIGCGSRLRPGGQTAWGQWLGRA